MSDEEWDAILDVHLKAPFRILRAAQPHISRLAKAEKARGEAVHRKVVNISSAAGLKGKVGQANYSSAKMGVIGLTKSLAKEWGRYNVNVNAVAYGLIRTRLTEAPAGGDIQGRKLPVGVNPDLVDGRVVRLCRGSCDVAGLSWAVSRCAVQRCWGGCCRICPVLSSSRSSERPGSSRFARGVRRCR
ncbi:SDR family NAD(P)-dependent oxidoreductase [Streptomyces sp. NPDC051643]|uniref:SDR family NAD(P)-dependent oxidoreductase n=1 Tax=Streptomyces sp. NPDC051643 TaxID=3365665 RepID=UPI0037B80E4C